MDKFELNIDWDKFTRTNAPWNYLRLNDPWSVGSVSSLIGMKTFKSKEDWERYYFNSGRYRMSFFEKLDSDTIEILEDEQLVKRDNRKILSLPENIVKLNILLGRTEKQLYRKGEILHSFLCKHYSDISIDECFEMVKYRVIGETWNGIVLRENKTIEILKFAFPSIDFRKASGSMDYDYGVDFELYNNDNLICGLQIKPKSYMNNNHYIMNAKKANEKKNNQYTQEFKVPVYTVYSSINGKIHNSSLLEYALGDYLN